MVQIPQFMTIRQVAATGLLPEYRLRLMEKAGELPCIYAGKKCLINFDLLLAQLNNVNAKDGGRKEEITMSIEDAVKQINITYRRVLLPGPCERYEVRQMEKALEVLSEELKKAVERKFS